MYTEKLHLKKKKCPNCWVVLSILGTKNHETWVRPAYLSALGGEKRERKKTKAGLPQLPAKSSRKSMVLILSGCLDGQCASTVSLAQIPVNICLLSESIDSSNQKAEPNSLVTSAGRRSAPGSKHGHFLPHLRQISPQRISLQIQHQGAEGWISATLIPSPSPPPLTCYPKHSPLSRVQHRAPLNLPFGPLVFRQIPG